MENRGTISREAVRELVFAALQELNTMRPPSERLSLEESTVLSGAQDGLDSLAMVNLVMALEQRLRSELSSELSLTSLEVVDRWPEIFATVASLMDFLTQRVSGHGQC